jgi:hypothetical protein
MKMFLRDNKPATSNWPRALKAHFPDVSIGGDNADVPADDLELLAVFLHTTDPGVKSASKKWAAESEQRFLVIVGSGGHISPTEDDPANRTYGCHWSSAEFESASIARIRSFVDEMQKGCFRPALLRPAPTENLLALRLLCEAWLLLHWEEASTFPKRDELAKVLQIDPVGYKMPEGIQLNAPQSFESWIAPFRETHNGDPVESIAKELVLEDAKRAARSFFADMSRAQPDFLRVAGLFLLLDSIVMASN